MRCGMLWVAVAILLIPFVRVARAASEFFLKLRQAYRVLDNLWWRIQIQFLTWRQIQSPRKNGTELQRYPSVHRASELAAAAERMEALMFKQYGLTDSQSLPQSHQFGIHRAVN